QRGFFRLLGKAGIGALQEYLARFARLQPAPAAKIKAAVPHVERAEFGGDLAVDPVINSFFRSVRRPVNFQRPRPGVRAHAFAPDNSYGLAANCPIWSAPVYTQFDPGETRLCASAASGHEWAYHL